MKITKAHLKLACEKHNWDLLDKLLETDNSEVNNNSMFTDTWGEYWSMLLQCVFWEEPDAVSILLQHGANSKLASWGDGMPITPIEAAKEKPEILKLLKSKNPPKYIRKTDPSIEEFVGKRGQKINDYDRIEKDTGLTFSVD